MKQNSRSSVSIPVELVEINNKDVMIFTIDDDMDENTINLNSSTGQAQMKQVFAKILKILLSNDVKLELSVAEGYAKGLYIEVCREYIDELNRELVQVKSSILEIL